MRLFAQTLAGDVKKSFKYLPASHIVDLPAFHRLFIKRWERKKNPLQILSEYENIRRATNGSVQDYCVLGSTVSIMQSLQILNLHQT